jgi:hypothetical protein
MGMVLVANFAARDGGPAVVTMMSTFRRTSSAAPIWEPLTHPLSITMLNCKVLTLHVTQLVQPRAESLAERQRDARGGRPWQQNPDAWDFLRLVRLDWKAERHQQSCCCKISNGSFTNNHLIAIFGLGGTSVPDLHGSCRHT